MRNMMTVFRREMAGYFATPVAYIFIVIFLAFSGTLTFFFGNFFERGQAGLQSFFMYHPWLYLVLVPAISMRLWAEERKSGTIELIMTLPISLPQVIIAKHLAAWCFTAITVSLTFPIWITVNYLGNPDNGVILAAYLGSLLMAGAFLAIGSFISALTKNQVIAYILSAAVCFLFIVTGTPAILTTFGTWLPELASRILAELSFITHFSDISKGVLDLRDMVYFASIIALFLALTGVAVHRNKAS